MMLLICIALAVPLQTKEKPLSNGGWTFKNVAAESGFAFKHTFGDDEFQCILEDTGSGIAFLDYDADGLLDIYCVDGAWLEGISNPAKKDQPSGCRLYRNRGNGAFEDVTDRAKVGSKGYGMGAAVGDYDNDGDVDLCVLNYGPNVLYQNQGDGTFRDVTESADVAGAESVNGFIKWSVNGVFFDLDGDRDLDLYVSNYLAFDPSGRVRLSEPGARYAGPEAFAGQSSTLYRNDGGRFIDVTEDYRLNAVELKSMGASLCDFDGDGFLDLFEAGDFVPNLLFHRREDGSFLETALVSGLALDALGSPMASMHGCVGDFDNDGQQDLFVPNLEHGCLYRNLGKLRFEETSERRGVAAALNGLAAWGAAFADFDNDGDLDLLAVTGGEFTVKDVQPMKLLQNDGTGRFEDVSAKMGPDFAVPRVGRGAAFGDIDNDGDVDFAVNCKDGHALLMRNDLPKGNHWLQLKLVGTRSCRDAIGARVTLRSGHSQVREVQRSNSYLSQNDARVHFGLGKHTEVEELSIRWPAGSVQKVVVGAVDRMITVVEAAE